MKLVFPFLYVTVINLIFILLPQPVSSVNKTFSTEKNGLVSNEKIYLHFDRNSYNSGETIWYKAYLINTSNNKHETLSKVAYIEFISPNNIIIDTKTIKINNGTGHGHFKLPEDLTDGDYTIRAYTNFMRNFDNSCFFRKRIKINPSAIENKNLENSSLNISFFPEGGTMINGFLNRMGFKAFTDNNKGVHVTGTIVDDTNQEVLHFKTSKFGLGQFQFIPQKGKKL